MKEQQANGVQYGGMESYRASHVPPSMRSISHESRPDNMCRFYSGPFALHPLLLESVSFASTPRRMR